MRYRVQPSLAALWQDSVAGSLQTLRANPARTLATIFGLVFGVASLLALMIVVRSVQEFGEFEITHGTSATTLTARDRLWTRAGQANHVKHLATISSDALRSLSEQLGPTGVVTIHELGQTSLRFRRASTDVRLELVDLRTFLAGSRIIVGRGLVAREDAIDGEAVVASYGMALELVGESAVASLVGVQIRLNGVRAQIVGVQEPAPLRQNSIIVGLESSRRDQRRLFSAEPDRSIGVVVSNVTGVATARAEFEDWLARTVPRWEQVVDIEDGGEDLALLRRNARLVSVMGSLLALLSILSGGVGLMNVQLVSLSERAHEIGIRRAVGARSRQILHLVLLEAVILSAIGAVIGAIVGLVLAHVCLAIMHTMTTLPLVARYGIDELVAVAVVATLSGVAFGWIPARRAAKMSPLDAIRAV